MGTVTAWILLCNSTLYPFPRLELYGNPRASSFEQQFQALHSTFDVEVLEIEADFKRTAYRQRTTHAQIAAVGFDDTFAY